MPVTPGRSRRRLNPVGTKPTTIRPTVEVREQMDAYADETGQSLTLVIEEAWRYFRDREEGARREARR